ncbi:hypothetical protein QTP88_030055 [Uroleucon formosanum]
MAKPAAACAHPRLTDGRPATTDRLPGALPGAPGGPVKPTRASFANRLKRIAGTGQETKAGAGARAPTPVNELPRSRTPALNDPTARRGQHLAAGQASDWLPPPTDFGLLTSETCCGYRYEPTRRLRVALSRIFKVRVGVTDTAATSGALRARVPIARLEDSRDVQRSQRKENSSRTPRRLLRVHSGCPDETKEPRTLGSGSASGSGIRTGFPLAPWAIRKRLRPWYEDLSPGLGSTDSWTTAVHKKPFSTAAPEGPSRVFATTTKICTDGGSRRSRDLPFDAHRRAILLVGACRDRPPRATAGPTVPPTAEYRHDAPAPSIFRASCFGSNQRLSWSLNTRRFRRLNSAFGSSRSASSAYQKWPTKRLGFRRRLRTRFTRCTSYPEGNFGWNQLLDGSISLSPLYPAQTIDLHVRIAADLHQGCAPGRPKPTWRRRPRTADQRDFERRWVRSLGHRPHRKRFTFIAPNVVFLLFNFPSRYLSTIGLVAVFSLRWSLPPASGCTLKQPDSKARSDPGTL